MALEDWLGWVGAIIGAVGAAFAIVGIWLTIRASKKQDEADTKRQQAERALLDALAEVQKLQQRASAHQEEINRMRSLQRRLDWSDVDQEAVATVGWLKKEGRQIDLILAPGARGAIYGQRIAEYLGNPPMVVGITLPTGVTSKNIFQKDRVLISTDDWSVEFPDAIRNLSSNRVLVVDDYVRGGSFMTRMRSELANMKFLEITTVALVAMRHGVTKIDYAAIRYNEDDFRFPWGIAS